MKVLVNSDVAWTSARSAVAPELVTLAAHAIPTKQYAAVTAAFSAL